MFKPVNPKVDFIQLEASIKNWRAENRKSQFFLLMEIL